MSDNPKNETNLAEPIAGETAIAKPTIKEPPFGSNEMRLNSRQWLVVLIVVLLFVITAPRIWQRMERLDTGTDYRIPYALSSDYWLYQRRIEMIGEASIPVLGDSVVWGEYVRADGTLSHFLNHEMGISDRFINCGVNGLFPLSMEGLVSSYASSLRHRKIILQCNVLWLSSPKADLSTDKEETFNHSSLVPQFFPKIPCYRADASARLGAAAVRNFGFFGWVGHVDSVYFNQQSVPLWSLQREGDDPPSTPNIWRNPLAQITMKVPGEPAEDPLRGRTSSRHKAWNSGGASPARFEWVSLDASLQWQAFQRTVKLLQDRGNDVFVVLGPFNESMVAEDQRPILHNIDSGITGWLNLQKVPNIMPDPLPSTLYADASHPLTDGYELLAKRIYGDTLFQKWLNSK